MKYLNLGCGYRFHSAWTNVNFTSTGEGVIAHNLTQGTPFPDGSFDVVYHSHVLEHFSRTSAESFLRECYRILSPKGILRIVVPDLEQIARTYLIALEQASSGSQEWADNYEWILLEMFDQVARNQSGGDMAAYLFKEHIPNQEFIFKRCGTEAKNLIAVGHMNRRESQPTLESQPKRLLKGLYCFLRYPDYRQESLIKFFLGKEYSALQIGRFRLGGEVHQWMYDRHSLTVLLEKCGFQDVIQQTAAESHISSFTSFNLDTEGDGTVYKPDSIFIEAIKPET
jgi:predicted SAM-dependent methyltransferase